MNIQTEKLQLIEWLVQLTDLELLNRIKSLKDAAEASNYEASLKPMTKEELIKRAEASNLAIREGRVSDIDSIVDEDWDQIMNVLITDPAKNQLKKIYRYFRRKGNGKKGREVRKAVLEKAKLLRDNPFLGQVEEELASMGLGHRYLVVKPNYKIIYLVAEPTIFITDIFDTRQDPTKMQPQVFKTKTGPPIGRPCSS